VAPSASRPTPHSFPASILFFINTLEIGPFQTPHFLAFKVSFTGHSELAQSWADPLKRISGEVGVQSFIATFLAESVNKFLSETAFASAGCRLYWRIVGLGKSGRPDLELVLSWMDDRGQVIEKILAVIEVKTTYSMSPSHATNIRQATDAGIIIDQRGEVRVAQAQRLLDGPKRIIQQVSTHLRRHPLLPFSARFRC